MSSVSHNAGTEAPVTIKVFFDGASRRVKLPLRDMVPKTLEKHVRAFLQISDNNKILIERYSDSAAAYVFLDSTNMSVYKQLYRAAKAKSKLKLRVTVLPKTIKPDPQPASVEDEPSEPSTAPVEKKEPVIKLESPASTPVVPALPSASTIPLRDVAPRGAPQPAFIFGDPAHAESKECSRQCPGRMDEISKLAAYQADVAAYFERRKWEIPPPPALDTNSKPSSPIALKASSNLAKSCPVAGGGFAVCCNSCEKTVSDTHFHCSTCDDGDFDLCPSCVEQGINCYNSDHWLIKRTMKNGQIVNSTTETIIAKPKPLIKEEPKPTTVQDAVRVIALDRNFPSGVFAQQPPAAVRPASDHASNRLACLGNMRTCNCCVQELPEREFLHCAACDDYDLCQPCFAKDAHGHHPKHGFAPAVAGTQLPDHIKIKMGPGRNQLHHAICDGCDKYITGVRHKCLECPDWDYCSNCITKAHFMHPMHRFAPVYEPLPDAQAYTVAQPVHIGICCDGPLCSASQGPPSYIRGIRYKCAVCHDLDFCANCEASPDNRHNKTHPLIKFKTPIRHVSVTTTGERQDGKRMPAMGDRCSTASKATETLSPSEKNSMNPVRTVVDVKPIEPSPMAEAAVQEAILGSEIKPRKIEPPACVQSAADRNLRAVFVRESVQDGTILPPMHVFEQTWTLRNEGNVAWPAGCSIKFVGGDYMGHIDAAHPAGISELVSASESTVCYAPLTPGLEFSFTVLLRTPAHACRAISYWRLTSQDGLKFGDRLWCEVNVRSTARDRLSHATVTHIEDVQKEGTEPSKSSSIMIFPKLDKESPNASIHCDTQTEPDSMVVENTVVGDDGFDDCGDKEWAASEDGFMTDDEYDILDASDEEYMEEQRKRLLKK